MKNKKEIIFKPQYEIFDHVDVGPKPAVLKVPQWYKDFPNFINKKFLVAEINQSSNLTVKMCPPFLDALTCGYIIQLPFDILVFKDRDDHIFKWDTNYPNFIDCHNFKQYPNLKIPEDFDKNAYKFNTTHGIETPAGYSLLFTHPLNRIDLPFFTLSGIVDSDSYDKLAVNLPFFIKKDFEGKIEKGTPIAQIIPIKRESWTHKIEKYNEIDIKSDLFNLKSTMLRSYKNKWWNKKHYF